VFKGSVCAAVLGSHRASHQSSHKLVGDQGGTSWAGSIISARGYCQTPPRQQDRVCIYQETRGNKESNVITGGLPFVEGGLGQRRVPPGPPLAINQGQCGSGLPVQEQYLSVGVQVGQNTLHDDHGVISSLSHTGRICIQENSSAPKIHDLVPGSSGCGQGCSTATVGQDHIPVSTSSTIAEGAPVSSNSTDQGNISLPTLANGTLVVFGGANVGGATFATPPLQTVCPPGGRGTDSSLSGSSGSSSHFRQEFQLTHSQSGLDQDDLNFLSSHLADGTKAGYGYVFNRFRIFCEKIDKNPHTCEPAVIVKYIRSLYENGAEYSTVNHHRSSISKFHNGFGNGSAGSHPLVSQAVRAVFRLKPPLPKYIATFDISLVFSHIKSLPSNSDLSLKLLSLKALFLLTASTISRVSSVHRLGPDLLIYEVSFCILFKIVTH
jgi:hypothetical protein